LLAKISAVSAIDFREAVKRAKKDDLIYMDPPYQGTSFTRDHRYYNGLAYDDFADALSVMNQGDISYISVMTALLAKKCMVKFCLGTLR